MLELYKDYQRQNNASNFQWYLYFKIQFEYCTTTVNQQPESCHNTITNRKKTQMNMHESHQKLAIFTLNIISC